MEEKGKYVKKSKAKFVKPSTDSKLEQLDQKWSERFSRLEAMLLSIYRVRAGFPASGRLSS